MTINQYDQYDYQAGKPSSLAATSVTSFKAFLNLLCISAPALARANSLSPGKSCH